MKYCLYSDEEKKFFTVRATGSADVEKIHAMLNELMVHNEWHKGMDTLLDFSEMNFLCLDTDEIVQLSTIVKSLKENLGDGQCALVTNREIDFGLARMWQMMTEHHVSFEIEVFTSVTDAEQWLCDQSLANL